MKHVLYISYDGMTDPLGQSQVLPYLTKLSKSNFSFHLISFEKKNRYEKDRFLIERICDDNNIYWYPMNYHKKPPVFSTLIDLRNMYKKSLEVIKHNDIILIHARSYISSLIALKIKNRLNIPFLFDMRGFWADERVEGEIWNLKNPIFKFVYNYFKKKEIKFIQKSDHIISLTNNGKNEILKWNSSKIEKDKISVIPCCVDLKLFSGLKKKSANSKFKNKFVLGYIGSIGTWYMLDEMLDFFKILVDKNKESIFYFITRESKKDIIDKAKSKNINPELIYVQSAIHNEVPLLASEFNASVFFIKPSFSKKASSPTKLAELMALNIPLVCNSNVGDVDSIVNKFNAGKTINEFNQEEFSEAAEWILNNKINLKKDNLYNFSVDFGVEEYKNIYLNIISNQ